MINKLVEKIKKHFDKTDKHIFITTFIIGIITNFYFFISNKTVYFFLILIITIFFNAKTP